MKMIQTIGWGFGTMALALGVMLVAGCESDDSPVSRVEQQVTGNYPTRTRTFQGQEREVYMAARQALKAMGYRVTKGGPAEGFLDASSRVEPGDDASTSRQFGLHAEFQQGLDGKTTDVIVSMSETEAPDSPLLSGRAGSEVPLRDTPLYEVFFRGVQDALAQPDTRAGGIAAPVEK
jgi:hypothetical protein